MKSKRINLRNAVGQENGTRKPLHARKRIATPDIVGIAKLPGAVRLQTSGTGDNYEIDDDFDAVARSFADELVTLTALHCVDDDAKTAQTRPETPMVLNPDRFTYRQHGAQTVIAIEGVPRDLVVRETVAEIDALIDGVN